MAHGAQVRRRLAGARVRVRRLPHRTLPASVVGERQLAGRHALVVEPRGHVIGQVVLGEVERQPLLAEHDRLERSHRRHDPAGAVAVLRAHGGHAALRAQVERRRVRTGGLPGRRGRGRGRGGGAGERAPAPRGAGGALRQAAGERGQRGQRDDQQKAGSRAPLHDAPWVCEEAHASLIPRDGEASQAGFPGAAPHRSMRPTMGGTVTADALPARAGARGTRHRRARVFLLLLALVLATACAGQPSARLPPPPASTTPSPPPCGRPAWAARARASTSGTSTPRSRSTSSTPAPA